MEQDKNLTFLDGKCDIYRLPTCADGGTGGLPKKIFGGIPLNERVVGSRRAFEAMQAGHTISRVIRVPLVPVEWNDCFVVVGTQQFSILQVQKLPDTSPKCWQLTLEQPNIIWALEQG